jgi:hypothetical protein
VRNTEVQGKQRRKWNLNANASGGKLEQPGKQTNKQSPELET